MIRLVLAGLRWNWRGYWPVVLGTALGTAVLVGSLGVGDALRAALEVQTEQRLGPAGQSSGPTGVDVVVRSHRPVSDELAGALGEAIGGLAHPILNTAGSIVAARPVARVDLWGVDPPLWSASGRSPPTPRPGEVILNRVLADDAGVGVGDQVTLRFGRLTGLPADSSFTRREGATIAVRATIVDVLDDVWPSGLSLRSDPRPPRNAFVDRTWLAATAEMPRAANLVFVADVTEAQVADALDQVFRVEWTGVTARIDGFGDVAVESNRMLMESALVKALVDIGATQVAGWFAYAIETGTRSSPFAVVAGVDPSQATALARALPPLANDEVAIHRWLADDLGVEVGDSVSVRVPVPSRARRVEERAQSFTVAAFLPEDGPTADSTLMPDIEGIADEATCGDWDPGFPLDLSVVREQDEAWWASHGGAPKLIMSHESALLLFDSPFGAVSSARIEGTPEAVLDRLSAALSAEAMGVVVDPVRARMAKASEPANDFGMLFLGFDVVLMASALLLTVMLLGVRWQLRASELGTLRAVGFSRARVAVVVIGEGLVASAVGVVVGVVAAPVMTSMALSGLNSLWSTAVGGVNLSLQVEPSTQLTGAAASLSVAMLTLLIVAWRITGAVPRDLLLGATVESTASGARARLGAAVAVGAMAAWGASTVDTARDPMAVAAFFGVGFGFLVAGNLAVVSWLRAGGASDRVRGIWRLGVRAAARQRNRALSVVVLLSLGTYLVVGVAASEPHPPQDPAFRGAGTGGFALIGTTTVPVSVDLSTSQGLAGMGLQGTVEPGAVVPLLVLDGDDASCLNLGSAQSPRLLGVNPDDLHERGAFTFLTEADWLDLSDATPGVIPAIGDEGTVRWALHLKVGDELEYIDEAGDPLRIRIVGMVASSVLQGSLLVRDHAIREHFPSIAGHRMFLVDAPPEQAANVRNRLLFSLENEGSEWVFTSDRLSQLFDVERTYMAVFGVLGGLGLLLGGLGGGIVVVRNVTDRRRELALLQALGWSRARLVLWLTLEHAVLLAAGLVVGGFAAVIAALPVVSSPGHGTSWSLTLALVGATAVVGVLGTALAAVATVPRRPGDLLRGGLER